MGWLPTPPPPPFQGKANKLSKNQKWISVLSFSFHVLRGYFYVSLNLVPVFTVRMLINFVTQLLTISCSYNYRPYWTLLSAFTIVYNYPVDKCFIFRFHDAGYYFWKLSVQCLDLVSGAGSLVTSIRHLHDYVILLRHQWAKQIWPH